MIEERQKLAVFIDFDNVQIGVRDTVGKEFDVALVLEALKERGEVVTKIAYGDWHRHGEQRRQMAQHAVQMVQRTVNLRGDKNAADINLALDALELAFTRHHINTFAIVGGDSDYMPLVEKLKEFDKRVLVVGGREFTSHILQKNCHEFIAYENLLEEVGGAARAGEGLGRARASLKRRSALDALPTVERALKILADRELAPQLGLLKSTILRLDSTFSEREYGARSFLEFIEKLQRENRLKLRRTERTYLVERVETEAAVRPSTPVREEVSPTEGRAPRLSLGAVSEIRTGTELQAETGSALPEAPASTVEGIDLLERLRQALETAWEKTPNRPLYIRQLVQTLRELGETQAKGRQATRAVLDLLRQAQKQSWVRLQRDRNGVLRIFRAEQVAAQPALSEQGTGSAEVPVQAPLPEAVPAAIPEEPVVVASPLTPQTEAPTVAEPTTKPRRRRTGSARRRGRIR